ncbi:MAG: hypothetical protein ACOCP8_04585 [archaeon]
MIKDKSKIKKFIIDFLNTSHGKEVLKKYKYTCDVTPKNIYTEDINLKERYIKEAVIIHKFVEYFYSLDFSLKNILSNVKEINEYYPWISEINFCKRKELELFNKFVQNNIIDFFSKINPRQYGEYYTPLEMIDLALSQLDFNNFNISEKVIDPSCGSGFFLYVYIKKLYNSGKIKKEDMKVLQNNIYGNDIFPFAIITTKLLLGYLIYNLFNLKKDVFSFNNIRIRNTVHSLKCKNPNRDEIKYKDFNFILGNPPFFRIDPNYKNGICDCISYGHNYAHSVFLHWSIQHLKNNGKLCLFLPQSMLSGYYYQKSRKELLDKMNLDLIITNKDHEKDFNVQQDIMILLANKKNHIKDKFHIGTSINNYDDIKSYTLPTSIIKNDLNVIPIIKNNSQYKVLKKLSKLEVIKNIDKLNMATGNFVWNQNKDYCFKEKVEGSLPLISGPNITKEGIKLNIDRHNNFPYCFPDKEKYIKQDYAILYRRMSPIGNKERMIASIIDPEHFGPYVVENHVNILTSNNKDFLNEVFKLITSRNFNTLINAFCHTNQISNNELKMAFEVLQRMKV